MVSKIRNQNYVFVSATLVESIMAVLIISISFSIALFIFINGISSGYQFNTALSDAHIQKIVEDTKQSKSYYDQDYKFKNYSISKRINTMNSYHDIIQLDFTVKNTRNKLLYKRSLYVYAP